MFQGYFLNLPRSEKRRAALLAHIAAVGAADRYEHLEAVEGRAVAAQHPTKLDPGNLGLWLSHEKLLQAVGLQPPAHLHLIEDDAVLPQNAATLFDRFLTQFTPQVPDWDLLFTDVFIAPQTETFTLLAAKMQHYALARAHSLVDLARLPFCCTSSMFINRSSVGKYARLLTGQWRLGMPIDMYLRQLVHQGQLKAFLTVPFMTSISAESDDSDIRGGLDLTRRVCDLYRRGFFQEADLPALLTDMQRLTTGSKIAPLTALYLQSERFSLSDQFVRF
jgi:GR25 family glycosyltransferase involved in LPS biosynthesis